MITLKEGRKELLGYCVSATPCWPAGPRGPCSPHAPGHQPRGGEAAPTSHSFCQAHTSGKIAVRTTTRALDMVPWKMFRVSMWTHHNSRSVSDLVGRQ